MTANPPQVQVLCEPEPDRPELLTFELRSSVYDALRLTQTQRDELEAMIAASPGRDVGTSALRNVRAAVQSKKNGTTRITESHTCELPFLYSLELESTVLGYYTQVPCANVLRERNGRLQSNGLHLDFLVFRANSIELVECKYESWLEEEVKKDKTDYRRAAFGWTHGPLATRAAELGIRFRIWAQRTPMGMYVQNLEACYALKDEPLTHAEHVACKRVRRLLREYPYSIEALNAAFPEFTEKAALWMMTNGFAYGLMRSSTPIERDHFFLFASRAHAEAADAACFATIKSELDQPRIDDPVLSARTVDLEYAERRLARLQSIEQDPRLATVRMTQLAKAVAEKVANGMSPLAACLTNFGNCGQETPSALTKIQRDGITHVITTIWNKGKRNRIRELWRDLKDYCEKFDERPPCESTLAKYVAREDPTIRALARGGMRAYHAVRPRAGGDKRSLPPLGYGYLLIIDSSDFDARCAANLRTFFPAEKPRFYLGIDGASGMGMAHAFIFGAARTDGMAILLREYVHRHGFLPRVIQVDRGPENTSLWLKAFCRAKGITLRHTPTGGSRYNGAAENAIKLVNTQIAHRIAGSTEPDMAGRKVDGRFKSRKTARHAFELIHKEFVAYVYSDIPRTPDADGITPTEKKEEILATVGCLGTPCEFDDAFLIHTSVSIDYKVDASERSGIRTTSGYFTSDELQRELRDKKVDAVRSDCVNPAILWVKVGTGWWKAFHRTSQVMSTVPFVRRIFELLFKQTARAQSRSGREEVGYDRHKRHQQSFEASAATSHLAPSDEPTQAPVEAPKPTRQIVDWDSAPMY